MKKKLFLNMLVLCFIGLNMASAQGFKKPSEGKAAVYFTRTVAFGSGQLIDIFDGENYIAYSMGKGYSVYECDPGEHIFWIAAENTNFFTADLEAGKVYIAQVYVYPGVMKGRVKVVPQCDKDEPIDGYNDSVEIVNKLTAKVMKDKTFDKRKAKLVKKEFMATKMKGYNTNIKGKEEVNHMSADMNVPESAF